MLFVLERYMCNPYLLRNDFDENSIIMSFLKCNVIVNQS